MPSCTRAPPESLMKTNGDPVFRACCMISATFVEWISPAEPPATVKSWLARWTSRPPTEAAPVITPSAGMSRPAMPNSTARCSAKSPDSRKLSGSTSASTRSRAVSFPALRCFSSLSAPPPSATLLAPGLQLLHLALHRIRHAVPGLSPCGCGWRRAGELGTRAARGGPANARPLGRGDGDFVRPAFQGHVVGDRRAQRHRGQRGGAPAAPRAPPSPGPCPGSSGLRARLLKNRAATCGNIATVSTSSSLPSQPGSSSAIDRSSSHSGFRRSAGRTSMGGLLGVLLARAP